MLTIKGLVSRATIASALLLAALAVQAEQGDAGKERLKSGAAAKHAAGPIDTATCIQEAAKMNMATIKFAQLANQKAANPELKRFSQALEQDHRKAQTKLEGIAQKHGVSLPTAIDAKCEAELAKLEGLTGAAFDNEFAKGAVEGHAMAMAHLEKASKEVKDSDLSQYTKEMLATVKEHQRVSRQVAKAVGVDEATITFLENKAKDAVGSPGEAQTESSTDSSDESKESQKPNGSKDLPID